MAPSSPTKRSFNAARLVFLEAFILFSNGRYVFIYLMRVLGKHSKLTVETLGRTT